MREKIKVLFLAADPFRAGARRELDEQMRAVDHALQRGPARHTVELVAHFAQHVCDVQDALLRHQPQVVHFAAHGDGPAAIYLGDEHGRRQAVDRDALRGLLGVVSDSVRIVVLDGADTFPTVQALSEVADYTIGTNRDAGGVSAIGFVGAFYGALAMGCTVLAAFERGLGRLELEGIPGAAAPVRRIRRGVNLDATLVPGPGAGEEQEGRRWTRRRRWAPARRSC
jgi:hypothetical protein